MWNISRANGPHVGVQARQYSTMPGLNKWLPAPVNDLPRLWPSFDSMHKISTQKRFVNPNFPSLQTTANTLVEKCSIFAQDSSSKNAPDIQENTEPSRPQLTGEPKENAKHAKMMKRKSNPTKKTTRHSVSSSPRRSKKGKTKNSINLKYEVEEIGLDDALSDSYDSDLCSSPAIDPEPHVDTSVSWYDDVCKLKPTVVISINKPKLGGCRSRLSSDCGSEDSFVVFQCGPDDVSDASEEDMDTGTESDDEDSDDSSCSESNFVFKTTEDVVDFAPRPVPKKVRFADDLLVVHHMHYWAYAYRAARKGPWEEYVRDRARLKDRARDLEDILGPFLRPPHRQRIYDERFARTEDDYSLIENN